jgi:hypothetical protein
MQLHLETAELNLVANLLLQKSGTGAYDELLEMVMAHDLRFDSGQLELVANLLAAEKRSLKEEVARAASTTPKADLQSKLALLERALERVDEACVMF